MTKNAAPAASPYRTVKPVNLTYLGVPTVVSEWRKAGQHGLRVLQYQQGSHLWAVTQTGNGFKGTLKTLEALGAQQGKSTTPEQVQALIERHLG
jgi:hypothetical protein